MIKGYEKMKIPNIRGENTELEFNWYPKSNGEYVKIRVGDKESVIPRGAFLRAAMLIGTENEQVDLIPTQSVPVRHFIKKVVLKLTKSMEKGEYLTVPVAFDVRLDSGSELNVMNNII